MVEREHGVGRDEPERDEAVAVDMASPTAAADDETYRRLMALGRGVQADFDEALAELAK